MTLVSKVRSALRSHPYVFYHLPLLVVFLCWLVLMYVNASSRPPAVTFIDDAAADLEWARVGVYLHGHWSNTLGTFHPGPWYLTLVTLAGRLGAQMGVGFDTGAVLALACVGVGLAAAAGHAMARVMARPALVVLVPALWMLAAATTSWRHTDSGEAPAFGQYAWAGALIPWAVASLLVAAYALTSRWRFAPAYALAVAGVASQLYLPAMIVSLPLVAIALWQLVRRPLGTLPRAIGGVAALLGWGPLLVRAVVEGPLTFWPRDAHIDVAGRGVVLEEGLRTVSAHLFSLPVVLALGLYVVTAGCALVLAFRRRGASRARYLITAAGLVGALAVQVLLWPGVYNRYQTAWLLPSLAVLLAVLLSRLRFAAPLAVVVLLLAALTGGLITDVNRLVGADPVATGKVYSALMRAGLDPTRPVGVAVDARVWNAGQTIVHHVAAAGYMPCTIGRVDLPVLACESTPVQVIVARPVDASEATVTSSGIGYNASILIDRDDQGWKDLDLSLESGHQRGENTYRQGRS